MHIFTYGSLMFAPVWQQVVRGRYQSTTAKLNNFIRLSLHDDSYPGMIARTGEHVSGVLYCDVSVQDVAALDVFEGSEYRRDQVEVITEAGVSMVASTYIFLAEHRLAHTSWEPDAFQMTRFIDTYCRNYAVACANKQS